jgi:Tol biopolymer transport system component
VVFDQTSDDGRRTFVFRERAAGGGRVLILRGGWDPALSPDGRFVAAFRGTRIVVATRDGNVVRTIPAVGEALYLSWSPDGRWLGYVARHCADPAGHEDPSCGTLWVVRADGTGQRRASREDAVSLVTSFEKPFTWSPDGRRVAYAGNTGLVVSEILTGRRHLLGPTARLEDNPDWSPDGKRLLYRYGSQLVTSTPDGRDRRIVRGAGDTTFAAWSPDGTRIAYIHDTGSDWIPLVSRPDGSGRLRLGVTASDAPLIWSSDGRWVLTGDPGGDRYDLFRTDRRAKPRVIPGGENGDWR